MSVTTAISYRLFDPARDWEAAAELVRETNIHDDEPWVPSADSLVHDWAPTSGYEVARDTMLAFEGERLVGVARVGWRERTGTVVHNAEVWVRPGDRRRGIGTELARWVEAHSLEALAEGYGGRRDLPHVHGGGTDRANEAATEFARSMGYAPVRFGYLMERDLTQLIPDIPLPDGIEVRPVVEADHRRIWAADVEAFKDHWENAVREESDYIRFFKNPDLDTTLWQVAWDGDEVAGSVLNCIYFDENRALGVDAGWLDHVSVRREWRGRGVASALIARSLAIHRARGMAVARLGVDAENPTGALGVYERLGFTPLRGWATQRKPFPDAAA
ncbi:MAG TPA: GNAT family N-acetyltransferase [Candidatus Limnocylindrales bacterium]|nr:GNAT family N-acetyltransferase [Candidatus Limnocylindrales bacterium]